MKLQFLALLVLAFSFSANAVDTTLVKCAKQKPLSDLQNIAVMNDEIKTEKLLKKNNNWDPTPEKLVCGMTEVEWQAIRAYTHDYYALANEALRYRENLELHLPYIRTLNRALLKLAPYKGVAKRGTRVSEWNQFWLYLGLKKTYSDKAYMSASRTKPFHSDFTLTIKSKTCRYIAPFSGLPEEEEVLCFPSTKFRVRAFEEAPYNGDDTGKLVLEEI